MASVNGTATPEQPSDERFARVQQLARSGQLVAARSLCEEILATHPRHTAALNFLAMLALQQGDLPYSVKLLQQALEVEPERAALHRNLALAYAAQRDWNAAVAGLDRALALQPGFAAALLDKGAMLERLNRSEEALANFYAALEEARTQGLWLQAEATPPNIRSLLAHATVTVQNARAGFIAERLRPVRERHGDAALARVDKCIDIYLGRRPLQYLHPQQRPTFMLFPDIPARNFFDREEFPELDAIEQATPEIQAELEQVMSGTEGFRPFIEIPDSPGAEYWQTLNHSPNWNAFFFYRDGVRYDGNCRRCPKTAAALDALDLSRVPEHSPEALFSILTPGTHIPPHTGVTNTRLVCHLPLVIPGNGALKVAGEAREWSEGRCMIFDDTFEHEAWNDSDRTRVVLIFDLWNPYLTPAEREAISVAVQATGHFNRQMNSRRGFAAKPQASV
ncbi:MAG TPA: aspartyl/asparaginyl beta-hydroxylase domain-containing protein [Gammaproteobacteria bacterium]|nr:aspartyl/asparaginyl beta-hydroxylase domain-containing protein [Gammaproteobacteria bacterium]